MKKIIIILLLTVVFAIPALAAGKSSDLKPDQILISYVTPSNPAHQPIYAVLKERRVLERFKELLSPLKLPVTLLLKVEGCDGESNAWYDAEGSEHTVTCCYEYLDEVLRYAPKQTTAAGVTSSDAIVGPTIEVFLHEVSHAVFDLLKVPIFGREEDAADQLAAFWLLQLGKEEARKTVSGVAFMYNREAQEQNPQMKNFADVHGLSAQRLYNLLCLAYGADSELFADVVAKGYLPKSRAEGCSDEYRQVSYAVEKLIRPYVDETLRKKVKAKKLLMPEPVK
jgi:hypothetical protein